MPQDGIHFIPTSENAALDKSVYGTTWVSETFVRRAILAASGDHAYFRIRRGLANEQDIYVVSKERHRDLDALELERQARVLRASTKRKVSLEGAYVEQLVVNLFGGAGESEVFLDELTVGPPTT